MPSNEAAAKAITKDELSQHCRRRTRGAETTEKSLEELILAYTGTTDTSGVPLFKEEEPSMISIFTEQKKHLQCIQDPDIWLYTQIRVLKKGKRMLPVYRCARGTTSVESFHCHLSNFIPGKSANALNFQAYLLDGLARWNKARKDAASGSNLQSLRTFDAELQAKFNILHREVHGKPFNIVVPPNTISKEVIGVEYLFQELKMEFDMENVEQTVEDCDGEDASIEEDIRSVDFDRPELTEDVDAE